MTRETPRAQSRREFAQHWLAAEPSVSVYVFSAVRGFHDAEDVVQQIAQELARRFDEYDPERPFLGWALWIARSRVIDFYRRRDRDRLVFSEQMLERLGEIVEERAANRSQRRAALELCLDEMPERSRTALDLRYVDDASSAEIADALGSTVGATRVFLTRLRTSLADCIRRRLSAEGC